MPNVAVFLEQRDGQIKKVAWQMISAARGLVDKAGGETWGLLLHAGGVDAAEPAGRHGAQRLYAAEDQAFNVYDSELWATAVASFCRERKPDLLLIGATALGKDLGPKVAAKLGWACLSDCTGLTHDGGWVVRRPMFAGKVFVDVTPKTAGAVVGIRPNAFPLAEPGQGPAALESFDPGLGGAQSKARVKEVEKAAGEKVTLTEAEIIVSGGRGIKGPENYHLIEELAETLGAAAGASRAIVDAGWVDYAHQVGQTGKTVSPNLYIACGISGAIQHLAGMSSSKVIVAINKDASAPIFKVADYGIVADLFQVLPALNEELRKLRD